jgi:hypothetical protein
VEKMVILCVASMTKMMKKSEAQHESLIFVDFPMVRFIG